MEGPCRGQFEGLDQLDGRRSSRPGTFRLQSAQGGTACCRSIVPPLARKLKKHNLD